MVFKIESTDSGWLRVVSCSFFLMKRLVSKLWPLYQLWDAPWGPGHFQTGPLFISRPLATWKLKGCCFTSVFFLWEKYQSTEVGTVWDTNIETEWVVGISMPDSEWAPYLAHHQKRKIRWSPEFLLVIVILHHWRGNRWSLITHCHCRGVLATSPEVEITICPWNGDTTAKAWSQNDLWGFRLVISWRFLLSPPTLNQHGNPEIAISSRKRLPISYSGVPFPCLLSIVYERLCIPIGGKHDLLSTYVEMTWNDHNTIFFYLPWWLCQQDFLACLAAWSTRRLRVLRVKETWIRKRAATEGRKMDGEESTSECAYDGGFHKSFFWRSRLIRTDS